MSAVVPTLLRVTGLRVEFGAHAALSDVSFDLFAGETLGLVGESGSGKSTLARAVLRLIRAARGTVEWRGQDLLSCDSAALRRVRRDLQIVFQDPFASLNPRMTVGETLAEPLRIYEPALNAAVRGARVNAMLERVGLSAAMSRRYPHEFSGGQCQRIGIARAMILGPRLLICDEPVSSLDVSIQGQILNLLLDLQRDVGTAMLFISHNLAVVSHLSHRITVMHAGRLVELASRDALLAAPVHPYTRALWAAAVLQPPNATPHLRAELLAPNAAPAFAAALPPASATRAESGCAYRYRCAYALSMCAESVPPLAEIGAGHWVACHRARELMS